MQLSRLFNLVVVQSTLVLGACDDDPGDDTGAEATDTGGDDEATTAASSETSGTTHAHDAGTTEDGTGDDGGSTGAGESSSGDDAPELACSDDPLPDDPCGCPCCWAIDCVNTDTACCGGFSELCTPT
jgi:hypothetical protein